MSPSALTRCLPRTARESPVRATRRRRVLFGVGANLDDLDLGGGVQLGPVDLFALDVVVFSPTALGVCCDCHGTEYNLRENVR